MDHMKPFLCLNSGAIGLGELSLDEKIRLAKANGLAASTPGWAASRRRIPSGPSWPSAPPRCWHVRLPVQSLCRRRGLRAWTRKAGGSGPTGGPGGHSPHRLLHALRSPMRDYAENLKWHVNRLGRMVSVLRPHGIELGVEFLGEHLVAKIGKHPFIYNLEGMAGLFRDIGPGAGVIFDMFHWYGSGGSADTLADELKGMAVTCVHLNDAVAERGRLEQIDKSAGFRETGVIDIPGAMRALMQCGYDGPVIVEPFKPWTQQFAAMGPDAACREGGRGSAAAAGTRHGYWPCPRKGEEIRGNRIELRIRDLGFTEGGHGADAAADLELDHARGEWLVVQSGAQASVAIGWH